MHESYKIEEGILQKIVIKGYTFYERSTLFNRTINSLDYKFGLKVLKIKFFQKAPNYRVIKNKGWNLALFLIFLQL